MWRSSIWRVSVFIETRYKFQLSIVGLGLRWLDWNFRVAKWSAVVTRRVAIRNGRDGWW